MIETAEELAVTQGVAAACAALVVPRSSLYRARSPVSDVTPPAAPVRPAPPRALSQAEKEQVRDLLNSERFQDAAPREVYAELLDEERYLCSIRTMYRILTEHAEVCERRNQLRHPAYRKPELLATGPNQVWSWDITKLRGPSKGVYYHLYAIIDIYSRYVVGWMIAEVEAAELAEQLIVESCARQGVQRAQLTIHADNGSPMIAKTVAVLLADLGVTKSHSRPHVSDDNPYSEAQFKTLKYRPDYPDRFGSLADARSWGRRFFHWYNEQHHHTGLGLLTPAAVHAGRGETMRQQRQVVLERAFQAHPERFVHGRPQPARLPEAVWINPPKTDVATSTVTSATDPLANAEPTIQPSLSPDVVAQPADLPYAAGGRTEDRATLRSDSSAVPADETDGQSCSYGALSTSIQTPAVSSLKAINRTVRAGELRSQQRTPTLHFTGDRHHIKPLH
jgi:transposase InsO family protein